MVGNPISSDAAAEEKPAVSRADVEAAIAAGADAFITGEVSEPQAHYAREMGVAFLACGHHATERYGAPAVAERNDDADDVPAQPDDAGQDSPEG